MKRSVVEVLKTVPPTERSRSTLIIDGLFLTCLIASALSCWATDYWVVMTSYLVASLALAWNTVAAHNYIHMKTNWRMYLFNFSLWSYRCVLKFFLSLHTKKLCVFCPLLVSIDFLSCHTMVLVQNFNVQLSFNNQIQPLI